MIIGEYLSYSGRVLMAKSNEFLSRQMCHSCYQIHVFVPSDRFTTAETPFSRACLSKNMRDTGQTFQCVFDPTPLAYLMNRALVWAGRGREGQVSQAI